MGAGYTLKNYKKYAKKVSLPVFLELDIGGPPENPDELFIVMLDAAKSNKFSKQELTSFRKDKKDFYWDAVEKNLK